MVAGARPASQCRPNGRSGDQQVHESAQGVTAVKYAVRKRLQRLLVQLVALVLTILLVIAALAALVLPPSAARALARIRW